MIVQINQMPTYALVKLFSRLIINLGDLAPTETMMSTDIEKTKECELSWF